MKVLSERKTPGEFPGTQWLGLQAFTAKGKGSIAGSGSKIPQAGWHDQKKKQTKRHQKEGKELVQLHSSTLPISLLHFTSDLGSERLIHQGAASVPFLPWPGLWDLVLDEFPLNGPLEGEKGL